VIYFCQREPEYVFSHALERYTAVAETFLEDNQTELEELVKFSETMGEADEYQYELNLSDQFKQTAKPVPPQVEQICGRLEAKTDGHYVLVLRKSSVQVWLGSEERLDVAISHPALGTVHGRTYMHDLSRPGWALTLLYTVRS